MVVPTFVRSVIRGKPLTIHGDGKQSRTFSDVSQAVDLLWKLAATTPFEGQVVNLAASDAEIKIIDLAHVVMRVVGREVALRYVPYDVAFGPGYSDPVSRRPYLGSLRQSVGDWAHVPLECTIERIAEYESARLPHATSSIESG